MKPLSKIIIIELFAQNKPYLFFFFFLVTPYGPYFGALATVIYSAHLVMGFICADRRLRVIQLFCCLANRQVFPFSTAAPFLERVESMPIKYSCEQDKAKETHTTPQSSFKSFSHMKIQRNENQISKGKKLRGIEPEVSQSNSFRITNAKTKCNWIV